MSTLKQVAKEAHVSVGTVSNVIRGTAHVSPELRERVLTAIRELEYYPGAIASDLVKQTYMLGMVLPDITNPFFPEMMREPKTEHMNADISWLPLIRMSESNEKRRSCRPCGQDASTESSWPQRRERIPGTYGPRWRLASRSCVLTEVLQESILTRFCWTMREALSDVWRHLIRAGHHRIAIITGPLCVQSARERFHGYRDALEEAEIRIAHNLVQEGDYRKESGYKLGRKLAKMRDRPSAIFVCNGMMTLGVLEALRRSAFNAHRTLRWPHSITRRKAVPSIPA